MCLDPEDKKSSGITDKVLRSINPETTSNTKEKEIRQLKKDKLKKEIHEWKQIPSEGMLPNFRLPNVFYPEYISIGISPEKLERLCHKIVRGITYFLDKNFIENNLEIHFAIIKEGAQLRIESYLEYFQKSVQKYDLPGIKVLRLMEDDNKTAGFYTIEIWGRLKMYAVVKPNKQ